MKIHNITIRNFKSCYEEQTFEFDDLNGLVKLSGPIGSGKTLLCEALQWGLLGTVKGQPNTSLISWNTQACEIEINLTSKNKKVYIKRNICEPLIVEIDGKPLIASNKRNAQSILEEDIYDIPKLAIVKMCLISFNGFSSLADMNPAQTKEFIDEIFGFKLFTEYNNIVQEEKVKNNSNLTKLYALLEDNNEQIKKLENKKEQQRKQLESSIDLQDLKLKRDNYISIGKPLKDNYKEIEEEYKNKLNELNSSKIDIIKIKNEYATLGKQEKQYINTFKNGLCPTCGHAVDMNLLDEHKQKMYEYANKYKAEEVKEKEIENNINNINSEYKNKLNEINNKIQNIKDEINKIDYQIALYNNNAKLINDNYDELINSHKEKIENINKEISFNENELLEWNQMSELLSKNLRYNLLNTLIPHINKSISYFINRLEQPYRIEYDKEFKAHIYTDSFEREISYNNLSTGQKKTIDIAIVFGILQNVISNVDMNVIVLDELMSNMDSEARNVMLSVLKDSLSENKSIFIINHAEMNDDYFDHKIRVSLKNKKIRVQLKKKDEPKDLIVKSSNYEKVF